MCVFPLCTDWLSRVTSERERERERERECVCVCFCVSVFLCLCAVAGLRGARNVCPLSVHFFFFKFMQFFGNRQNNRFVPPPLGLVALLEILNPSVVWCVCVCMCVCVCVCARNLSLSVRHSFSETFEKLFLTECMSTLFEAYKNLTCTPTKAC